MREAAGSDRHRTRPLLHPYPPGARCRDGQGWGAVNEILPADKLLAREIVEGLAKLPPLTASYTRIALTQKLHRIIDEGGVEYGLAFEVISAADVARARQTGDVDDPSPAFFAHCRQGCCTA